MAVNNKLSLLHKTQSPHFRYQNAGHTDLQDQVSTKPYGNKRQGATISSSQPISLTWNSHLSPAGINQPFSLHYNFRDCNITWLTCITSAKLITEWSSMSKAGSTLNKLNKTLSVLRQISSSYETFLQLYRVPSTFGKDKRVSVLLQVSLPAHWSWSTVPRTKFKSKVE